MCKVSSQAQRNFAWSPKLVFYESQLAAIVNLSSVVPTEHGGKRETL